MLLVKWECCPNVTIRGNDWDQLSLDSGSGVPVIHYLGHKLSSSRISADVTVLGCVGRLS